MSPSDDPSLKEQQNKRKKPKPAKPLMSNFNLLLVQIFQTFWSKCFLGLSYRQEECQSLRGDEYSGKCLISQEHDQRC
jgi:hypothetical protein